MGASTSRGTVAATSRALGIATVVTAPARPWSGDRAVRYPKWRELAIDVTVALCTPEEVPTGYPPAALATWAERARAWADGHEPDDLPTIAGPARAKGKWDVFVYMIAGAKLRAPAAAMALIAKLR